MATQNFYPHMIVGNISKISTSTIQDFLISYQLTNSQLITDLIDAYNNQKPLSDFKIVAQAAIDSNNTLNSKTELYTLFPEFNELVEMLATNDANTITPPSGSVFDIIAHESKLWDSLIAHFIVNINPNLTQDLVFAVKLVGTLKKVQDGTLNTKPKVLTYWKKSTLVYPTPPFPLPKIEAETIPEQPPSETTTTLEELLIELKKLNSARTEITELFDFQLQNLKNQKLSEIDFKNSLELTKDEDFANNTNIDNAIDIDFDQAYNRYANEVIPDILNDEYTAQISDETKLVLEALHISLKNINVSFFTQKLDVKLNLITNKIARFLKFEKIVLVGDSLIRVDNAVYEDLICNPESKFTHCELLHQLAKEQPEKTYVQILGMGYANIIKQSLLRYEADEVAHIENILAGEKKEKTHRNLKIKEETFSTESEKTEETETDTKSTDRFELSKEVNKLTTSASQFEAGLNVSGGYGPVSFSANVGFASQNSSSEASSTAVKNAKELTERAINRIQERVLEKRSVTTINEVEVTNVHGVDNTGSTEHISGFYYWVDKVYENQIINIGKRLMLEFMVPEPAAYFIYNKAFSKKEGVTLTKPIHPAEYDGIFDTPLKSHKDITRSNYNLWAALYNLQDISSPPLDYITVSKAYSLDYTPGGKLWHNKDYNDLEVKEGYEAHTAFLQIAMSNGSGRYIHGFIGRKYFSISSTAALAPIPLDGETDLVPFSHRGHCPEYSINVEILCKLSDKGFENWQIQTYNSIINAYNTLKAEYDFQVSSLESNVAISGQNPLLNRKTEQTELKKWGLELLTLQRFNGFNAMKRAKNGHPEIDFNEALNESKFVKFFEQSIEWHNMTYLFYPYFWSPKQRWTITQQLSDTDSKFTDFLQAGYARVVVPVHPKFTEAILHYLNTGEIWAGEELPAIDDELYLSIIDEIQEAENNNDGEAVGDPWETRIPTNMVMLSSVIPDNLPGS